MVRTARSASLQPPWHRRIPPIPVAAPDAVQGRQPRVLLRQAGLPGLRRRGAAGLRPRARTDVPCGNGPALRGSGHRLRCSAQRQRFQRRGLMVGPGQAAPRSLLPRARAARPLHGLAPSCIGSHYAVRTHALKTIGGIGPELAEDFSTSFLLTSAGGIRLRPHRGSTR